MAATRMTTAELVEQYLMWEEEQVEQLDLLGLPRIVDWRDVPATVVPRRRLAEVFQALRQRAEGRALGRSRADRLEQQADKAEGLAEMLERKDDLRGARRQRERAEQLRTEAARTHAELES